MVLKAPLYAQYEVTNTCNLACAGCLNDPRYDKDGFVNIKREPVNMAQVDRIAEGINEWGVFRTTITGGEPLAVLDRTFSALDAFVKNDLDVNMNSNMALAKEDVIKKLLDHGLRGILTSIGSYKSEVHDAKMGQKGALEKTANGIRMVKRLNPNFNVGANMVLNKRNINDVYETAKFVAELGVDMFSVTPLTPSRNGSPVQLLTVVSEQELYRALEELVRARKETGLRVKILQGMPYCFLYQNKDFIPFTQVGCDAGQGSVSINPYGDVRPCVQIPDVFGNILRDDLSVIWENLKSYQNKEYVPESCEPCDLKHSCGGGCRADAERRTKTDLKARHPFAKEPIKLDKVIERISLKELEGKRVRVKDDLKYRQDDEMFIVQNHYEYAFLTEPEMNLLTSLDGSIINDVFLKSETFASLLTKTVETNILEVV